MGQFLDADKYVAAKAIDFFQDQFTGDSFTEDLTLINLLPREIIEKDTVRQKATPTDEEVKKVVFELNSDSACGTDAFTGHFIRYVETQLGQIL